jgi:hypothetical protein
VGHSIFTAGRSATSAQNERVWIWLREIRSFSDDSMDRDCLVDQLGSNSLARDDGQQDTIPSVLQRPGLVIGSRCIEQLVMDYLNHLRLTDGNGRGRLST